MHRNKTKLSAVCCLKPNRNICSRTAEERTWLCLRHILWTSAPHKDAGHCCCRRRAAVFKRPFPFLYKTSCGVPLCALTHRVWRVPFVSLCSLCFSAVFSHKQKATVSKSALAATWNLRAVCYLCSIPNKKSLRMKAPGLCKGVTRENDMRVRLNAWTCLCENYKTWILPSNLSYVKVLIQF